MRRLLVATAGVLIFGSAGGAVAVSTHHLVPTSVSVSKPLIASPSPTIAATPVPNVNKKPVLVHKPAANVNTIPTPTATPALPPDDQGSQRGAGIWTPYNPNCYADCFPDLTEDKLEWAMQPYQGSYQVPDGPPGTSSFKGLTGDPDRDHYNCEYFHVAGYLPGIEACKGIE